MVKSMNEGEIPSVKRPLLGMQLVEMGCENCILSDGQDTMLLALIVEFREPRK